MGREIEFRIHGGDPFGDSASDSEESDSGGSSNDSKLVESRNDESSRSEDMDAGPSSELGNDERSRSEDMDAGPSSVGYSLLDNSDSDDDMPEGVYGSEDEDDCNNGNDCQQNRHFAIENASVAKIQDIENHLEFLGLNTQIGRMTKEAFQESVTIALTELDGIAAPTPFVRQFRKEAVVRTIALGEEHTPSTSSSSYRPLSDTEMKLDDDPVAESSCPCVEDLSHSSTESECTQDPKQLEWDEFADRTPVSGQLTWIMNTKAEYFDVCVAKGFGAEVTIDNMQCLKSPEWCNDEVLNMFNLKLQMECHDDVVLSTFFYTVLARGSSESPLDEFRQNGKLWASLSSEIFKKKRIWIPIHLPGHWGLAVVHPQERKIRYLDSLCNPDGQGSRGLEVLERVRAVFAELEKEHGFSVCGGWDLFPHGDDLKWIMPQQNDCFNCGFFVALCIFCSIGRECPDWGQWAGRNMDTFKRRMGETLLSCADSSSAFVDIIDLSVEEATTFAQQTRIAHAQDAKAAAEVEVQVKVEAAELGSTAPAPVGNVGHVSPFASGAGGSTHKKRKKRQHSTGKAIGKAGARKKRRHAAQQKRARKCSPDEIKRARQKGCCNSLCMVQCGYGFLREAENARKRLSDVSSVERGQFILDAANTAVSSEGRLCYNLCGKSVCRKAFEVFHGVSKGDLDNKLREARDGGMTFVDQRRACTVSSALAPNNAPTASQRCGTGLRQQNMVSWMQDTFKYLSDRAPNDTIVSSTTAYLAAGTKAELHTMMIRDFQQTGEIREGDDFDRDSAGDIVNLRVYTLDSFYATWRRFYPNVKMPKNSRFSKCDVCTKLLKQLRASRSKSERAVIYEQRYEHIQLQARQRQKFYKHRRKARNNPGKYLSLIVDGMDCNNLTYPYLQPKPKGGDGGLHVKTVGVLAHGQTVGSYVFNHTEMFRADSNITMTILHYVINDVAAKSGGKLPDVLYLQLDNCFKDNKNQHVLKFCADLVRRGIFKKVKVSFLIVGHTHEDIDQFFSKYRHFLHDARSIWTLDQLSDVWAKAFTPPPTVLMLDEVADVVGYYGSLPGARNPKGGHANWMHGHSRPLVFKFVKSHASGKVELRYKEYAMTWRGERFEHTDGDTKGYRLLKDAHGQPHTIFCGHSASDFEIPMRNTPYIDGYGVENLASEVKSQLAHLTPHDLQQCHERGELRTCRSIDDVKAVWNKRIQIEEGKVPEGDRNLHRDLRMAIKRRNQHQKALKGVTSEGDRVALNAQIGAAKLAVATADEALKSARKALAGAYNWDWNFSVVGASASLHHASCSNCSGRLGTTLCEQQRLKAPDSSLLESAEAVVSAFESRCEEKEWVAALTLLRSGEERFGSGRLPGEVEAMLKDNHFSNRGGKWTLHGEQYSSIGDAVEAMLLATASLKTAWIKIPSWVRDQLERRPSELDAWENQLQATQQSVFRCRPVYKDSAFTCRYCEGRICGSTCGHKGPSVFDTISSSQAFFCSTRCYEELVLAINRGVPRPESVILPIASQLTKHNRSVRQWETQPQLRIAGERSGGSSGDAGLPLSSLQGVRPEVAPLPPIGKRILVRQRDQHLQPKASKWEPLEQCKATVVSVQTTERGKRWVNLKWNDGTQFDIRWPLQEAWELGGEWID